MGGWERWKFGDWDKRGFQQNASCTLWRFYPLFYSIILGCFHLKSATFLLNFINSCFHNFLEISEKFWSKWNRHPRLTTSQRAQIDLFMVPRGSAEEYSALKEKKHCEKALQSPRTHNFPDFTCLKIESPSGKHLGGMGNSLQSFKRLPLTNLNREQS